MEKKERNRLKRIRAIRLVDNFGELTGRVPRDNIHINTETNAVELLVIDKKRTRHKVALDLDHAEHRPGNVVAFNEQRGNYHLTALLMRPRKASAA